MRRIDTCSPNIKALPLIEGCDGRTGVTGIFQWHWMARQCFNMDLRKGFEVNASSNEVIWNPKLLLSFPPVFCQSYVDLADQLKIDSLGKMRSRGPKRGTKTTNLYLVFKLTWATLQFAFTPTSIPRPLSAVAEILSLFDPRCLLPSLGARTKRSTSASCSWWTPEPGGAEGVSIDFGMSRYGLRDSSEDVCSLLPRVGPHDQIAKACKGASMRQSAGA